MEIEFVHNQQELVISRVTFTNTKIICSNDFPNRKPEKTFNDRTVLKINVPPSLLGKYDPLSMANFVKASGEVYLNSLRSVVYSFTQDSFNLWIKGSDDNSLFITLKYTVALYKDQILELFKMLKIVVYPILINSIIQNLSNEKPVVISHLELFTKGICLDWNRIFKMDRLLVSWNRLTYKIQNNNIIIKEYNSSFIKSEIHTNSENACLIPYIIDFMNNSSF